MSFEVLNKQISEYCEENHIMGMLRVTVRGRVEYEQNIGFADIENGTKFSRDSVFSFYSLSKPFCTIGFMKLVDAGVVDPFSHPSKYLPEAVGFDARVNYFHLLNHLSGLPDFTTAEGFAEANAPGYACYAREHTGLLSKYPSHFAPGEDRLYASINFVIPALTIENVTGMSYADYMKKEVFEPLGMKNAVVDNERLYVQNRVKGYEYTDKGFVHVRPAYDWLIGSGDIVGTIDDVYCLNLAIKNKLLLKENTWERIHTRPAISSMALGCTVTEWHGKRRITHNGGHTGFRTLHIQLPDDDFDIIFLSNCGFGNARNDISEMVYSAFYGEDDNIGEKIEMDKGFI